MDRTEIERVLETYTEVMKSILLLGAASLPESQFRAFRKFVLDRFGEARKKVLSILGNGQARRWESCRKGG